MDYTIRATANTPALIIYLLDISASMNASLGDSTRIEFINNFVEEITYEMVFRSITGTIIMPRYHLAIFAYNDQVYDVLDGVKTIVQLADEGLPKFHASGGTNTQAGFQAVEDLLSEILPYIQDNPAPMVCHITDGNDSSPPPAPIIKKIMQMKTKDGTVLVQNVFIGETTTSNAISDPYSWSGIQPSALTNEYAQVLLQYSSPLPASYAKELLSYGYNVQPEVPMMFSAESVNILRLTFTVSGDTSIININDGTFKGSTFGGEAHNIRHHTINNSRNIRQKNTIVNTGFSSYTPSSEIISPNNSLRKSWVYYFWLEIGNIIFGSIEKTETRLETEDFPDNSLFDVILFFFDEEIECIADMNHGTVQLMPDGSIQVIKQATFVPDLLPNDTTLHQKRLFFPVATPATAGTYRLRCNLYYQNYLLQSRLITAKVTDTEQTFKDPVLTSEVDYIISRSLLLEHLQQLEPNTLSIMLNGNAEGTHNFHFSGKKKGHIFNNSSTLSGDALQQVINLTREALREIAWQGGGTYTQDKPYRYEKPISDEAFRLDLIKLADQGYSAYDIIISRLAGDTQTSFRLQEIMKAHGQIQIALKEFAQYIVPLSTIYDYPLQTGLLPSVYTICPQFLEDQKAGHNLADCTCFQGNCPSYGQTTVICPSGFWGYRHSIGMPISIGTGPDAPTHLIYRQKPRMAVGVSTDKELTRRAKHVQTLQDMPIDWEYSDTLNDTLTMLKNTEAQIVYFYCHGGLNHRGKPYLVLGDTDSDWFLRPLLRTEQIVWDKYRPLVFINGCHTAALEPEQAMELVSGFVETSQAAGVIGTEITIFETLATTFAESCFEQFLSEGKTIGQAVRHARLELLRQSNPLGLVYIPYVMPSLRLLQQFWA